MVKKEITFTEVWQKLAERPPVRDFNDQQLGAYRAAFYLGALTYAECLGRGHDSQALYYEVKTYEDLVRCGGRPGGRGRGNPGVFERAWQNFLVMTPAREIKREGTLTVLRGAWYLGASYLTTIIARDGSNVEALIKELRVFYDQLNAAPGVLWETEKRWKPSRC